MRRRCRAPSICSAPTASRTSARVPHTRAPSLTSRHGTSELTQVELHVKRGLFGDCLHLLDELVGANKGRAGVSAAKRRLAQDVHWRAAQVDLLLAGRASPFGADVR